MRIQFITADGFHVEVENGLIDIEELGTCNEMVSFRKRITYFPDKTITDQVRHTEVEGRMREILAQVNSFKVSIGEVV